MYLFTLFSVCARAKHVVLYLCLSHVLGCSFLVFGNVIKGLSPMLVLFLYSFIVACCWRRVRQISGQSQDGDFSSLSKKKENTFPFISQCILGFVPGSFPKVFRSTIKEFRQDDVPCLLCTFSALGNKCEVAPRAFLIIFDSLPGSWRTGGSFCSRSLCM